MVRQVFFAQSSRFGQPSAAASKRCGSAPDQLLGHIGNAQIGLQLQLPMVSSGKAKNFQQGNFARPSTPDQAYALGSLEKNPCDLTKTTWRQLRI